ncbi:unnamed protein product [Dicrocoelium dendriticum]|nr:unnamed protein product [Dicrocoelium dendriticum]
MPLQYTADYAVLFSLVLLTKETIHSQSLNRNPDIQSIKMTQTQPLDWPWNLGFGLHIRGSSNYQSALKTNNTKHEGSSVSRHGGKYTHAKNVGMVLYQKYGVGCLQLVPMFETQSDDSCGFSALFRWMPHRASWPDEERASQYMVCCTQEILQTTTNLAVNHAPKDSQEPLSVLKSVRKLQLLVENLMLICDEIHSNENTSKTSPTNKPSFRSGLTKSQAFVTALKQNGSLSKPYAR